MGTLITSALALLIGVPVAVATAIYITEVGSRGARWVRTVVEAMIGLPDILAGLFIYVTLIIALGWGRSGFAAAMALAIGETATSDQAGLTVQLTEVGEYTLLIAKKDPGQGLIWLAFLSLISGIVISFYFPRRRVWTRLDPAGSLGIVWRSDRYVDVEREFGRLLDDLVAVRRPA